METGLRAFLTEQLRIEWEAISYKSNMNASITSRSWVEVTSINSRRREYLFTGERCNYCARIRHGPENCEGCGAPR